MTTLIFVVVAVYVLAAALGIIRTPQSIEDAIDNAWESTNDKRYGR